MAAQRGRPRDADARRRILESTRALLRDRGFDAVTIDAIAEHARVGRQTIYRGWGSKVALVTDATLADPESARHDEDPPRSVDEWIERSCARLADPDAAALLRSYAAAAAQDADAARRFVERVLAPDRDILVALVRADGSIAAERAEAAADTAIAALFFWVLAREPIDAARRAVLRTMLTTAD